MSIFQLIFEKLHPSPSKMMGKSIAKGLKMAEKTERKIRKKGRKLILRDMGTEGKHWKFYLANEDGTYTKAMTYDEVKPLYTEENLLTPKIANAIVTTSTDIMIRQGLLDRKSQRIRFMKEIHMRVMPPYRIPLDDPEAEKRATRDPAYDAPAYDKIWEEVEETAHNPEEEDKLFDIEDGVLFRYSGKSVNVNIPEGVKKVGDHAFSNKILIETINIPDTVETIGKGAFEDCKNLKSVQMSEGIIDIGERAFSGCSELRAITLPDGLIRIGDYAFSFCRGLKPITFPDTLIHIGRGAFGRCHLKSIEIPGSVKNIEECAFDYNSEHSHITLSEGVETIQARAFAYCGSVITIPNSVKYINRDAFSDDMEVIYYAGTEEKAKEIGLMDLYCKAVVRYNWRGDKK